MEARREKMVFLALMLSSVCITLCILYRLQRRRRHQPPPRPSPTTLSAERLEWTGQTMSATRAVLDAPPFTAPLPQRSHDVPLDVHLDASKSHTLLNGADPVDGYEQPVSHWYSADGRTHCYSAVHGSTVRFVAAKNGRPGLRVGAGAVLRFADPAVPLEGVAVALVFSLQPPIAHNNYNSNPRNVTLRHRSLLMRRLAGGRPGLPPSATEQGSMLIGQLGPANEGDEDDGQHCPDLKDETFAGGVRVDRPSTTRFAIRVKSPLLATTRAIHDPLVWPLPEGRPIVLVYQWTQSGADVDLTRMYGDMLTTETHRFPDCTLRHASDAPLALGVGSSPLLVHEVRVYRAPMTTEDILQTFVALTQKWQ